MQTFRGVAGIFTSLVFFALCTSTPARADKGAEDQLRTMIAANSLDLEGKAPFHIKIAFQYYDMDGKAAETGTAEEWWVAPDKYRVVITSPSLNEVFPAPETGTPAVPSRESYLVHDMLNSAVHPIPRFTNFDGLDARAGKHSADGAALSCVLVEAYDSKGPFMSAPTFCAEPKSNALRLRKNLNQSSIARNTIGVFHDVNVALDYQISYGLGSSGVADKLALTGHVTSLGTFNPAASDLKFGAPLTDRMDVDAVPEFFAKGRVLYQSIVDLPFFAMNAYPNAAVAVRGLIKKDGSIGSVVVMASPDKAFNESAVESVSLWKYKPYVVGEDHVELYADFFILYSGSKQTHIPQRPR
jgi:hypothetical protein